ncbi:hypothetical protein LPJ59_000565 [Coemansia sp. RSA 2399]|nr:hypothetical protein LPJ59_000565 [Coemansia sp. RSA 2399]KAJ1908223.1 hypothetical protein LPJ81_000237 [Coemansia sp. IMI 209127]
MSHISSDTQLQPQQQEAKQESPKGEAKKNVVCGGIAQINVVNLENHINKEVHSYSTGGFPRQSERYYKLMSVLHITRMLYHDGHCQPIHREFYRRLAQIHHQQQQQRQQQAQQAQQQQQTQQQQAQPSA